MALQFVAGLLWLTMLSVTLIESDAYRYATIILIVSVFLFSANPLGAVSRDWLALLCMGWGGVALSRFVFDLATTGERGASEWLYAFPLFFPFMGIALNMSWRVASTVLLGFFSVALLLLLVSTPFSIVASGERITPLFHHNSIHGAAGCGFIFIGAYYWALHQWEVGRSARFKAIALSIAIAVICLALLNIFGSKSKGVWFALMPALALMAMATLYLRRKGLQVAVVSGLVLLGGAIYLVRDNIERFGAATFDSVIGLIGRVDGGAQAAVVAREAISSASTPLSLNERLQLWSNALDVIAVAPIFGSGNAWLTIWRSTSYASVPYTLLHNGYLEILVRYGFFGLIVFGTIVAVSIWRVHRAAAAGIVSRSAFCCYLTFAVYFGFTILSNSNNRLALGESFALLFAAVCFACSMRQNAMAPIGGGRLSSDPASDNRQSAT
ncbi:O-antigen ligase family protein [Rhizobium sp. Root1220]|uniref:O-antigen ligase family protein n=1 Tax=Rhizobium sp. Root1220 TaxID=1736432 RepID=UPI0006F61125|nr:O-antigen ligase family protein [Rhizobium sp. Root1220]KQV84059.1 ligase [Rhizobium sp. Root1220]